MYFLQFSKQRADISIQDEQTGLVKKGMLSARYAIIIVLCYEKVFRWKDLSF